MTWHRRFLPYAVAIGSTTIALVLTLGLEAALSRIIGAFFYIAVATTAWYGGLRPGILAIVLSMLALNYYFMPPIYHLQVRSLEEAFQLTLFTIVSLIITLLSTNLQASRHKVEHLNRQLVRESADRLRTALNAAQMGMWDWDLITGEINWSPEHELLFGLPPGTFDGKYETFDACLHPDDRAGLNQAVAQALQGRGQYQHEYRVVWRDGSVHWLEGRGQATYDELERPMRMIGTLMAIDERKHSQLLLQQQLEQQRLVMEMTQRIQQSLNLPDILQASVNEVRQFLHVDRVILFEFAPDWSGTVTVESVADQTLAILPLNLYDPCLGDRYIEPFKQGLVTAKSDIYQANIDPCHVEFLAQFQIRANLVVPILKNDGLWGLMVAHHCSTARPWQDSEIDLLRQVALQIGLALQRSALLEQVQTELVERKQAEKALQKLNLQLEQRVAERTIELTTANDRLLQSLTELQQSKQEIEDLYHNAPCGYHSLDANGVFVQINDTELDWLGLTRNQVIHRLRFIDLLTPDSQELFHESFPGFKQTGWISDLEFQFIQNDGTTRWVNLSATALKDESGQFISSRSTVFDISDRKRAEAERNQAELALRESEERRRLALDLTHIACWDVHLPTGNTIWNDNLFRLLGLPVHSAEPSIELWRSHVHPDDLEELEREFHAAIADGTEYAGEYRVVHPDRSVHWLLARAQSVYDPAGQPLRSLGVLLDITERKQIEAALHESEEKFRQLADNIEAVFWIRDVPRHQVIYVSPAYETIWQRSCESLYDNAMDWINAIHPDDRPQVEAAALLLSTQGHYDQEYRILRPDGAVRWVRDRGFSIRDEAGQTVRVAGLAEDITERQQVEKLKNEFISIVSHELRTPLTSIRGSLGLLATGVMDDDPVELKRMIDIAAIDTERLVRLVNDVLDLEKLESGKVSLRQEWCNAADLMQRSLEVMQNSAQAAGISLVVQPLAVKVWVAPDRIIQTLTNLLSNAIKFSPPGGTVTLSAVISAVIRVADPQRVTDGPGLSTPQLLFSVHDQGRGIPTDQLETIFGRFQQVDASDSRDKGGTGLGLAICQSIVHQHNGQIWVESIWGQSTTFFFSLPLPAQGTSLIRYSESSVEEGTA